MIFVIGTGDLMHFFVSNFHHILHEELISLDKIEIILIGVDIFGMALPLYAHISYQFIESWTFIKRQQNIYRRKERNKIYYSLDRIECVLQIAPLYNSDGIVSLIQQFNLPLQYIFKRYLRSFGMNTLKKQKMTEEEIENLLKMSLLSPVISRDDPKVISFTHASNSFLPLESMSSKKIVEIDDCSFQSLHLISKGDKSQKDSEQQIAQILEFVRSKQPKKSQGSQAHLHLRKNNKQKTFEVEEAFQVPQLTAQSMISSQQLDFDNESTSNDHGTFKENRYKLDKIFHQQSQGSDDIPEHDDKHRIYHLRQQYAESKGSDRSQSDDIPSNCHQCTSLIEKCLQLEYQNAENIKQISFLKDQIQRIQQINRQEQIKEQVYIPNLVLKDNFLSQIQDCNKALVKINELLLSYAIDFRQKEYETLMKFSQEFKILDENVFGKEEKAERKMEIEQIHASYKKLISKMMKKFEEKDMKRDQDFKKIMASIAEKQQVQLKFASFPQMKTDRIRRKSKTYVERQQNTDDDFMENLRQTEQNKQRMDWLELNFTKEKQRCRQLQKFQREIHQKFLIQINELVKEKNMYKSQLNKQSHDFTDFMATLVHYEGKSLLQSEFWRNLSQRIFQISNCIPFEENDEQNLFAPQNVTELFDMIARIRSFYLKFEEYNLKKENEYQAEKNCFILFLKELVQDSKIPHTFCLELLENKRYENISYLREIVFSPRQRNDTSINSRLLGKYDLKLQKIDSFTFHSNPDLPRQ